MHKLEDVSHIWSTSNRMASRVAGEEMKDWYSTYSWNTEEAIFDEADSWDDL